MGNKNSAATNTVAPSPTRKPSTLPQKKPIEKPHALIYNHSDPLRPSIRETNRNRPDSPPKYILKSNPDPPVRTNNVIAPERVGSFENAFEELSLKAPSQIIIIRPSDSTTKERLSPVKTAGSINKEVRIDDPPKLTLQDDNNCIQSQIFYANNVPKIVKVPEDPSIELPQLNEVFKVMVQWNPRWLIDYADSNISPPLLDTALKSIPTSFIDTRHYFDVFSKLTLYETWESILAEYKEMQESANPTELEIKEKVKIVKIMPTKTNLNNVICEYYINQDQMDANKYFKEFDFVIVNYVTTDGLTNNMSTEFGIIINSKTAGLKKRTGEKEDQICDELKNHCMGMAQFKVQFVLLTNKVENVTINTEIMPTIQLVSKIRNAIMLFKVMIDLHKSHLCNRILMPSVEDFQFTVTSTQLYPQNRMNETQSVVVTEAASMARGDDPGIYCIKGPPGTGKSTVIVNIIFQILLSYCREALKLGIEKSEKKIVKPKILLVAPSNAAVDSVIMKLMEMVPELPSGERDIIDFVRIGSMTRFDPRVIEYTAINMGQELIMASENIDIRKKPGNEDLIKYLQNTLGNSVYRKMMFEYEKMLIERCNVVCTTLTSSVSHKLMSLKKSCKFTCCIIDEATQCHEIESLLPTLLDINKLILVGDPQQLDATILNQDARRKGFQESFFSRLWKEFKNQPGSPFRMLTTQYRMHPEICYFPNKQFYEGLLRSHVKEYTVKLPLALKPYVLFNFFHLKQTPDNYTNPEEAKLIIKLLNAVLSFMNNRRQYRIGIVTPYKNQKDLLHQNVSTLVKHHDNIEIDINTVDSFQGSECDVIIISCVREYANVFVQNPNRLNVALTRAKEALYVIGNFTLFKSGKLLSDMRENAADRNVLFDVRHTSKNVNFLNYILK